MVLISQNLNQVLLLIDSKYLVLPHQRNIVCEYKLHGKPIMKYLSGNLVILFPDKEGAILRSKLSSFE